MDLKEINHALNTYIRPDTFPLALRLCKSEEEVPPQARRPLKQFGFAVPVCQAIGIARRYGWTMVLGADDMACPYGALALGLAEPKEEWLSGSYQEAKYPGSGVRATRSAQAMKRLPYGRYSYLVAAPLDRAGFEPQLIVVYGNSAQVMRLIQGCLHSRGGALTSQASGGQDCADIIPQTLLSDECQFILPCNGDRIFGLTQDHEMAFAMPMSKAETTMAGLEASHKSGMQRYPIPSFLRFEAQMPPDYYQLMDFLKEGQ